MRFSPSSWLLRNGSAKTDRTIFSQTIAGIFGVTYHGKRRGPSKLIFSVPKIPRDALENNLTRSIVAVISQQPWGGEGISHMNCYHGIDCAKILIVLNKLIHIHIFGFGKNNYHRNTNSFRWIAYFPSEIRYQNEKMQKLPTTFFFCRNNVSTMFCEASVFVNLGMEPR